MKRRNLADSLAFLVHTCWADAQFRVIPITKRLAVVIATAPKIRNAQKETK